MTTPAEELDAEICSYLKAAFTAIETCLNLCVKSEEQYGARHPSAFLNVTECHWRLKSAIRQVDPNKIAPDEQGGG